MPNEMEEARAWLESEQNRPEVDYLLHLLKAHQELLGRQMDLTEQARRDRNTLRETSIELGNAKEDLVTKNTELRELMRLYRIEKDMCQDYGAKLTKALNMLNRVQKFCNEMQRYGMDSSSS